jgi:hypothetical protein
MSGNPTYILQKPIFNNVRFILICDSEYIVAQVDGCTQWRIQRGKVSHGPPQFYTPFYT